VSDVELAFLVEEGAFDVLLQDVGFVGAVAVSPSAFEDGLDLVQGEADDDAVAAVGELARFDYPDVVGVVEFGCFFALVVVLEEEVVLGVFVAVGEVEGEGEVVEDLFGLGLVVLAHGVEEGFFVAYYKVLAHVVLDAESLGVELDEGVFFESEVAAGHVFC
jgi:hypothetical protein